MRITFLSAAALAAVSLFQIGAYAQLTGNITANIPFSFHVGDKVLPAGNYTITEIGTNDLEVRNDATGSFAVDLGSTNDVLHPAKQTELVFRRYGNDEFLRQINMKGETAEIDFMPSKTEKKLIDESRPVAMHAHPAKHNKMAKHT